MNNDRRSRIIDVQLKLEAIEKIIEKIKNEEENYFDNMPENLQGSMRGCESEDAIECLDNCKEYLEKAIDELSEIV